MALALRGIDHGVCLRVPLKRGKILMNGILVRKQRFIPFFVRFLHSLHIRHLDDYALLPDRLAEDLIGSFDF